MADARCLGEGGGVSSRGEARMINTKVLSVVIVLLAPVLVASPCTAQGTVAPFPGTRLRATAPSVTPKPVVGTLLETTEHEVLLAVSPSERTAIPRAAIVHLELSQGRHGHAVNGLLIGAVVGAVALSAINAADPETGQTGEYVWVALVGAGLGALPGAGVGALVKTERWAELPLANLRVTVAPLPGHGMGLRLGWTW
jgi:hypothetical protein